MAFQSMTGYGQGECTSKGTVALVEVVCVNRKQLDVVFTLPRGYSRLEPGFQAVVRERISRGRVAVNLQFSRSSSEVSSPLSIDESLAKDGLGRLRRLADELGLPPPQNLAELASLVPFARTEESFPPDEQVARLATDALKLALDQVSIMRGREGLALQQDLLSRIDLLESEVFAIASRSSGSVNRLRDALLVRLREAGLPLDFSDERIAREVVIFADRCDISEEITRLSSHLAQFRSSARASEPVGRTLDFLCQEIFREINTIGSKTADHASSASVISLKTELERIREQVQNVE